MSYRSISPAFTILFLFSIVVTGLFSCKEKVIQQKPVKPNKFVAAYSSNQISSEGVVRVVLNLPEEAYGIANKRPPENVFTLQPGVKGTTYWADQNTLVFEPEKPLQNGKSYEAEVKLDKLFGIRDREIDVFKFYVSVKPLSFNFEVEELQPYPHHAPENNFLLARLAASDVFNPGEIEKLLTAEQDGRKLKINLKEELPDNMYILKIDSIERKLERSDVVFQWHGEEKVYGFNSDNLLSYYVPSIHNFELVNVSVGSDDDQYLKLEFSDPVDAGQNLDGLIYFTDNTPVRLVSEKNSIFMYPSSHLVGEMSIVIKKEVRKSKTIHLKNDIVQNIFFGQAKPQIRFTSEGAIMPGEDGWILPFETVNLKALDVIITKIYAKNIQQFLQVNTLSGSYQLNRVGTLVHHEKIELNQEPGSESWKWRPFAIDLSKMMNQEPGAIYRVDLRFRQRYSTYSCGESKTAVPDDQIEEYYYTSEYYYPQNFRWGNQDDPCTESYYNYNQFVQKNVLASNIGLTVKEDNDRLLVYANNLLNANPMSDVRISLFNFQQQKLTASFTNKRGVASLKRSGDPYLLVAEKDGQFAYHRLDGGSALSYSKFETGGVEVSKGIKGFIYGERGVWRPGDTLFLTLIVDDRENPLPAGHPVTLKLSDPRGKVVASKTSVSGVNGFYTFKIQTTDDALTGFWNASAEVGGAVFSKTLRIETIKPNRLKIDLNFDEDLLEAGKNMATLNVRWLHGGKASNLKADVNTVIRTIKTTFENFENFNFDDPARLFYPEELTIFDGKLDANGKAKIDFELPSAKFAPGMLNVNFSTKVYEQGGDFSIDQKTMNFAPFDYFVGIRGPETGQGYLEVDQEHEFEIATVKKTGEPVSVQDLEYEVYKLDWSWWYQSNHSNLGSYISSHYDRKVSSGTLSTKNGKGKFSIKINYPEWGWFYVKVKSPDDGHQTGLKIYLDWPSWYSRENRKAPGSMSLLSLSTDQERYKVGDEVKVSVPTPENSRLLVSVEKGSGQLTSWQMAAEGKETLISFKASPEMAPNVYLSVAVLQPYAQTVNDLPIRMYGVVPVLVQDANTILKPKIEIPESVRPGETYTVKVKEENNKSMAYTLAVVDEGLLDLTRFKTPSPHNYFYAKEALAVKTWDTYDDVMGAFGGRLEKVFAVGGDMEMELGPDKKKANRFKPVVTFLGPYELKAGETKSHKIKMPNYVGSVRVMLVAGENGAYGHASKTMKVKQPLMVLGTMPRVLAPGESLKLPVSVFVLDEKIKNVDIDVDVNDFFDISNSQQVLNIADVGEYMAYFDLKVALRQGVGKVNISVSSGNEKATYEVEIQVRNPNPRMYEVAHHLIEEGKSWEEEPEHIGIEGTNELNLTVSEMPPINLEKRLKYLLRYPYGCVEQTTSSVFPQLYLDKLLELNTEEKNKIERNILSSIQRLASMQVSDGGFSYWPGGNSSSDWGTTYAGHFLILAKEKGYSVAPSLINSWKTYQKNASNNWTENTLTAFNQAYRLYTLALAGEPNMSAMNRLRNFSTLNASARYRLAAAYALAGQKDVAGELIKNVSWQPTEDRNYWYYNYGSVTRDQAMMMETLLLMDEIDKAIPYLNQISEELKSNSWMSTQTTAYSLYAVSLFVEGNENQKGFRFTYEWKGKTSDEIRSTLPVYSVDLDASVNGKLYVKNLSEKNLFVTVTKSGIPEMGKPLDAQQNLQLKVSYFNMNGDTIDIKNLLHGEDFYVKVSVKNPGTYGNLENLALTQIFPSGWEIINTRMIDAGANLRSDKSDYIDYRDDRVNTFFSLNSGQTKSFVVLLNAAYQGKYFLPATHCSAMYNNNVSASKGGGWVNVLK